MILHIKSISVKGAIEVPSEYVEPLKEIIKGKYLASVQRAFNELLTNKE